MKGPHNDHQQAEIVNTDIEFESDLRDLIEWIVEQTLKGTTP